MLRLSTIWRGSLPPQQISPCVNTLDPLRRTPSALLMCHHDAARTGDCLPRPLQRIGFTPPGCIVRHRECPIDQDLGLLSTHTEIDLSRAANIGQILSLATSELGR